MDQFLGQLLLVGFNYAPIGWMFCNGAALPISGNEALFNLLGTIYGGDGVNTFNLPNLQGRTPLGYGNSTTGTSYVQGQLGGAESVTISLNQYPRHSHQALCSAAASGGGNLPGGAVMGGGQTIYADSSVPLTNTLDGNACNFVPGGNESHSNLQPYLTLNWIIAIEGVYPSQT